MKEGWTFRLTVPSSILSKESRCPALTLASCGRRFTSGLKLAGGTLEQESRRLERRNTGVPLLLSSSSSIPSFKHTDTEQIRRKFISHARKIQNGYPSQWAALLQAMIQRPRLLPSCGSAIFNIWLPRS